MNEFVQHIAEVEGVRTPKAKRSRKAIEKAAGEFAEKRSASKKEKAKKAAKAPKKIATAKEAAEAVAKNAARTEAPKPARAAAAAPAASLTRQLIPQNPGHTRSAGYDAENRKMHVEFTKGSVYEFDAVKPEEWSGWQATFEDAEVVSGNYFRKNFKGRNYRRVSNPMEV